MNDKQHTIPNRESSRARFISLIVTLVIICTFKPYPVRAQSSIVDDYAFPNLVDSLKRSIAFVQVKTDKSPIVMMGTAFVTGWCDGRLLLSTCYHTLFRASINRDSGEVKPDTSLIHIVFEGETNVTTRPARVMISREDRDIAILGIPMSLDSAKALRILALKSCSTDEIRVGLAVASTGYSLSLITTEFGKQHVWTLTYSGIINSVRIVGPESDQTLIDFLQVDMLLNEGASGSPIYRMSDGRVVGMFNELMGGTTKDGVLVPLGVSSCVPAWAIYKLIDDYADSVEAKAYYKW